MFLSMPLTSKSLAPDPVSARFCCMPPWCQMGLRLIHKLGIRPKVNNLSPRLHTGGLRMVEPCHNRPPEALPAVRQRHHLQAFLTFAIVTKRRAQAWNRRVRSVSGCRAVAVLSSSFACFLGSFFLFSWLLVLVLFLVGLLLAWFLLLGFGWFFCCWVSFVGG